MTVISKLQFSNYVQIFVVAGQIHTSKEMTSNMNMTLNMIKTSN